MGGLFMFCYVCYRGGDKGKLCLFCGFLWPPMSWDGTLRFRVLLLVLLIGMPSSGSGVLHMATLSCGPSVHPELGELVLGSFGGVLLTSC